ncbi:DUF6452 family protein [Chitinophaga sp. Hz27]|uniref:DUF6452 family protein n=1 Tax=Chitinophaga sp. Hz27 TaxID=3347169 RepID=UPI0035E34C2A
MKNIFRLFIAGALLFGFIACEDETKVCDQTMQATVHVAFMRDSLGFVWDTTFRAVTTLALNRDTLLKNSATNNAYFNLSPAADTSKFYLRADSLLQADTVTFIYTRQPKFISAGCGFGTIYNLDTVFATRHLIDSVQILQKSVTNSNDTHVNLFYFNE